MDVFTARAAASLADARRRAGRLRAAVPDLARELAARGATRVVLIGSLARGDEPNPDTDVDLVVWGLGLGDAYEAGCDLGASLDARVEVIPAEIMGPRLRAAVDGEGIDVTWTEAADGAR